MNYRLTIIFLLMFLVSCGSASTVSTPTTSVSTIVPINGSALSGLSVTCTEDMIELECSSLPTCGYFFSVPSTANKGVSKQTWQGDENILHLAVGTENGVDVGLIPLPDYIGGSVTAKLELNENARRTSIPPYTEANSLIEDVFSVSPEPHGVVKLEWAQVNVGDYNFDGVVNVADLTPIVVKWLRIVDDTIEDQASIPEFWVDGDHNTEINAADLIPIAQHYGSIVAGYQVTRNSTLLELGNSAHDPYVIRNPNHRYDLPPLYSVTVPGTTVDDWDVIPVDQDGEPGTSIGNVVDEVAVLKTSISIYGIGLIGLDGSRKSEFNSGSSLLRIVDPGEIVDGAEFIGHGHEHSPGVNFFYDLPRDELLYLQVLYYPEVDPSTGQRSEANPGGTWNPLSKAGLVATSIPFVIERATPMLRIIASISFESDHHGGYCIDVQPHYNPPMPQLAPERWGVPPLWPDCITRLDYNAGVTSMDIAHNGNYEFSPRLTDINRDGISPLRTMQLKDYIRYQIPEPMLASISGKIIAYYEQDGLIVLQSPTVTTAHSTYIDNDSATIRFAENTVFEELLTLDGGLLQQPLSPAALHMGEQVVLEVDLLGSNDPMNSQGIWLRRLVRLTSSNTTGFE